MRVIDTSMRAVPFLFLVLASVVALSKPVRYATRKKEIVLPEAKVVRLLSPDGRHVLTASPMSAKGGMTLALEDWKTGRSTVVKRYDRSLGVGWSPDGKAFFLNDAAGSNIEEAYVYRLGAVGDPLPLDDQILKSDPDASRIPATMSISK